MQAHLAMNESAEIRQAFFLEPLVKRLRLSLVLALALLFWASCAWFYSCAQTYSEEACFRAGLFSLALSLLLFGAVKAAGKKRASWGNKRVAVQKALLALCAISIACTYACSGALHIINARKALQLEENTSVQATLSLFVLEDTQNSTYGVKADCLTCLQDGSIVRVRLQTSQDITLYYGQLVTAQVELKKPTTTQRESFWKKGIVARAQLESLEQTNWLTPFAKQRAAFIESALAKDSSAQTGLFLALACGYRTLLQSNELYTNFQVAGLAHIVAVSGAHLSLAIAFVALLLTRLKLPKKVLLAGSILTIFFLLFVCAFPISAFRAAFMAVLSCFSFFAKRRPASQNALGLCIVFCLLADPCSALSASFELSALSTAGIILLTPLFTRMMSRNKKAHSSSLGETVKESLSLTLAASIATLPLSAALFSQISLIAPLSNVVVGFLFAPLCLSALINQLLFLVSGCVFSLPYFFCKGLSSLFSGIVSVLASIPYAAVPAQISTECALAFTAISFFLIQAFFQWRNVSKCDAMPDISLAAPRKITLLLTIFAVFALAVILIFPRNNAPYLAALKVGQGDALLLHDEQVSILVDTGNQDSMLKQELAKKGVYRLNAVFITHPDNDHCASLASLASVVEIEKIYVPASLLECSCEKCTTLMQTIKKTKVSYEGVEVENSFATKHFSIEVLWPQKYTDEGGNEDSLCLRVQVDADSNNTNDYTALLVGDAEQETLQKLINNNKLDEVDIYKVGHHGSKISCNSEIMSILNPKIALLSVGVNNRYGHPNSEILELLEQQNTEISRTDTQGTITCYFEMKGIRMTTDG